MEPREMLQLMKQRHSVRKYRKQPIEQEKRAVLNQLAEYCSKESGLSFQIFYDEPKCFANILVTYGAMKGCQNYIAIVGKKGKAQEILAGYYGEQLVLRAQALGLNTCWVGLTHGKTEAQIPEGEKLIILIALGYGETQGTAHKNKPLYKLCDITESAPQWYRDGMDAVRLAPTAVNQQKFFFSLKGNQVTAKATGGFYRYVDLGIVQYHFEAVTGKQVVLK